MAIDTAILNTMTPGTQSAPVPADKPDFSKGFNIDLNTLTQAWEKSAGAESATPLPPEGAPPSEAPPPTRDAQGRFVKQDGATEAASITSETEEAPASDVEATAPADTEAVAEDAAAPDPIVLTLPPTRDGEEELTLETVDPDIAERVRMLKNNGLRRRDFEKKIAAFDEIRRDAVEIMTTAQHAPEQLIDRLPPEQQARVAQYYLAKHFDDLRPVIAAWWEDKNAVREAQLNFRDSNTQAAEVIRTRIEGEQKAQMILRHVESLVPETASAEDAQDFLRDAEQDLAAVARARGGQLSIDEVPTLLAKRLARYGFTAQGVPSATQPASPATAPVLAPVGQTAASVADAAKRKQAAIRATQAQRAIAKQVAPPSQGAVPAQRPTPPKPTGDVLKDWDSVTAFVKQHGKTYAP